MHTALGQNVSHQGCCRRFTVGPGDTDIPGFRLCAHEQLYITDNLHTGIGRRLRHRVRCGVGVRDARAENQAVDARPVLIQ